ncbi:MAG: hypothetical protein LC687_05080 [Actinobacteria bacterium]|nr:hypothetical protein [Actinomycetota bacterium]
MNYVSEFQSRPGEVAFTSFNPQTKESVVVAKIKAIPDNVVWPINFGFVTYRDQASGEWFKLEWKAGAVPVPISKKHSSSSPKPQQSVKVWDIDAPEVICNKEGDFICTVTANVPTDREIQVSQYSGCMYAHFAAPLTWVNTENGEKKVIYNSTRADSAEGVIDLQILTVGNYILIHGSDVSYNFGERLDSIVADLHTGEVLLRTGPRSWAVGWAACPAK